MKAFFLLLSCILVAVLAQDATTEVVASWAGTTQGGPTFAPPSGAAACFAMTFSYPYEVVNTSFSASGVRQVAMLAESSFKSTVLVYLYSGTFDPANSCSNIITSLTNIKFGGGILTVDDPIFFQASTTYFFVITSSDGSAGKFALQVFGSIGSGTTVGGLSWNPSSLNTGSCTTVAVPQNFSIFTWSQTQTGVYDISALFEASALGIAASERFSLYQGNISAATIAAGSCGASLNGSLMVTANEGDRSITALGQVLTANTQYTMVVSNTYDGNFGVQVIPTRLKYVQQSGFTQPNRNLPCSVSADTNAAWLVIPVPAEEPLYIIETDTIPSYYSQWVNFDTYAFAYQGSNTNTSSAAPSACPAGVPLLAAADTGNITGPLVFSAIPGQQFTVIISTASGQNLASPLSAALVYVFTGTPVGNITVLASTNSSATTASATSSSATTTGESSSTSTSTSTSGSIGSPGTTGTPQITTATSTASSLAISLILLLAISFVFFF